MFRITKGTGFYLKFENGYMLSVQFGPGTYSEHRDKILIDIPEKDLKNWKSKDAEIAVFDPTDKLICLNEIGLGSDQNKGHINTDEIGDIIQKVRELPLKSVDLVE